MQRTTFPPFGLKSLIWLATEKMQFNFWKDSRLHGHNMVGRERERRILMKQILLEFPGRLSPVDGFIVLRFTNRVLCHPTLSPALLHAACLWFWLWNLILCRIEGTFQELCCAAGCYTHCPSCSAILCSLISQEFNLDNETRKTWQLMVLMNWVASNSIDVHCSRWID